MPSSSETSSGNPNNARRSSRVPKVAVVGGTAHLLTSPTKQPRTKSHFTPESSSSSSSSDRSDNSGDNKTSSSPTTNNPGSSEGEGGTAKPWRHPAELVYVRRQDWPQDMMITYLRQNVFSVPPRDNNKIQQLFDVTLPPSSPSAEEGSSEQRVVSLPKKYRVPLLFVAKFQWESLRLVLTSANPLAEWDEYKFDIVHLSRLCQHFLRAALKMKQESGTMDKSWRCPMFDRALTRFYRKWMISREWSVRKFWHEFAEEEYEIDVLKYDWIRWALKGHKGFLLTMDEVQHGITAKQFTTGLKKVDGAWTWDNEEWERARELTAPADASPATNEGQPTAPPKRRTKKVKLKKRSTLHMPIDVKIELLEEQGGLGLNGAVDENSGAVNGDGDGDERAGGAKGSAGDADSVIDLSRTTVDPESPPAIMEGEGAREEEEGEEDEQDGEGDDEEDEDEDEDEEMRDGWVATRQSSPGSAPSARSASTERGVNENLVDAMEDVRASSDGGARSVSAEGGVNGSTSTTRTTLGITPASGFQRTPPIVPANHPGSTSTTPAPTVLPPSTSLKRVRESTPPSDDNAAEHQAKKARVESVPETPDESESGGSKIASVPTVPSSSAVISSSTPSALTTLIKAMSADGSLSGSTAPSLLNPPTTSVPPPTTTSIQPTTTSVTATPSMSAVTDLGTFDSNTMYTPTTTTIIATTNNQPFRSRATPNRTGTTPYGEDSSGKGTAFVSESGTSVFGVGMGASASSLGVAGVGGLSTSLGMGVGSSSSSSSSSLGMGGSSSVGAGNGSSPSSPPGSSSFLGLGPTMLGPGVGSSVGMSASAGIPAAGAGTSLNASGRTSNTLDPATSPATATSSGSDIQPFAALLHRMLATVTPHKANDQVQSGNVDGSSTVGMPVNALGATPKVNGSSSALTVKLAAAPTMLALSGSVPSSSTQGVSLEVTPSATTSVIPAPVVSTPSDLSLTAPTIDPTTTSTTYSMMVNTSSPFAPTPSRTSAQPPTPIWGDNAQSVIAPPPLTPIKSTPIPIVARSPSPSVSSTASTPPAARTPAPAPPVVNPSVVLPVLSTASAASIFTAAAGDSFVTTTGVYTTTGVDSSSTTIGAELSTTTGDDSSTTLVAGAISSTKPVTPAPLMPEVVLPSTAAPIPSSEAPATTSFAPVQNQVEEASTGSGWPSNLFSSLTSPGASTTPASIASAAPLAAHTYAGSEDMEMSDEDDPKDPVEKPMDWSMDEVPSVPTVDEETSLMDQASRLLESVIGPPVEKRTAEAPVITVPPAVLPEVEALKDLPLPNNSSDAAPDQVAVTENDAPQQAIFSEPTVAAASISPLPAPEKEFNPPPIEASRVSISPVVSQPSVLPTPPLPTVLTAFAPQDNLDSHINVTSMNVVSAWGKPSLAKASVIKSLLPTLDRQIMQLLTPLVSALAAALPMAANTPVPAAGREGVRGTATRVTGDPWERALGIAGSMPKRRAAADPDAMDIDVQSSSLGAGAEKRETNVKSVVEARKAPREKEKQKEKETGKSTGAVRKGAEVGGSGQPTRKRPRREQEEEAETNTPTFAEVQSLEALLSLMEGSRALKESVAGGKAVMETRLDDLEGLLGNLKKKLDDVGTVDADRRFGAVDEKLLGVEGKISSVESALEGIKCLLEGASKKVGELSGSLEQRLHLLEQRTQFAEGRLQIVETRPVMLTASTQTFSLPQEAGIQTEMEMDELDYIDRQDRDVTMADVSEAHAHRVNESLAAIRDETVTKKVLSVMRNMADLLEFTKDGAVSKKGKEKEGEIEEEEPREEQEPVPDAQPQPSTEESAISTLLEEVRAMKEELRNSEQRARDEVEAIRAAHAAEVEKLKNEMLAKEKKEREELEETTRRHLEEFKNLKESMQEREAKQQQAAIQEQKVPQEDLIDLRRRLLYLETRNRVDNMSPDLPRSSPSSSTPPYNSIGRDSSHPLAHLFAYDAPTSPASRSAQGSPMKDVLTPTSGTPAPSYEKSHFSLRPLNGMGELDHSAPLPIKSQRKHQLMAFHRTHVE